MEYMFTPVRGKIQRSCSHSTPIRGKDVFLPNVKLTPIRSKQNADCGRCLTFKRLEQDLATDIPVACSPRLEIARKRVASNTCKAIQRRKEKIRYQQNDAILNRKRLHAKEKDRLLAKRYADLRKRMVAMLDCSSDDVVCKKSVMTESER